MWTILLGVFGVDGADEFVDDLNRGSLVVLARGLLDELRNLALIHPRTL